MRGKAPLKAKSPKVKTARFRDVVAKCGAPAVVTLWQEPERDSKFCRDDAAGRILTVTAHPETGGKDTAEVGFHPGENTTYLRFAKSLKAYAGRRIVGLDYNLLAEAEPMEAKPHRKVSTAKPKATKTTRT